MIDMNETEIQTWDRVQIIIFSPENDYSCVHVDQSEKQNSWLKLHLYIH